MTDTTLIAIGQKGRLEYEVALLAATLRAHSPRFSGRLVVMEPQPGGKWPDDPRMGEDVRGLLRDLGAEILPFTATEYGKPYAHGNKMEGLAQAPEGPFLFLDSDTVITGELADVEIDHARPSASMKRENTWPVAHPYGPGHHETWARLHHLAGLDFEASQDTDWPVDHWRRYLYFNAGWTFGADAPEFGRRWMEMALLVREESKRAVAGMPELGPQGPIAVQKIWPWLDQISLPLVVHGLGGGRPGAGGGIAAGLLDGTHSWHWRIMGLMYATAPDHVIEKVEAAMAPHRVKKVLKQHRPFQRYVLQDLGGKARELFDQDDLPHLEAPIRERLKRHNLLQR